MTAFSTAERDRLAKSIFSRLCTSSRRELYDKESGSGSAKWITIGGGPGAGGEKHSGGTPVKVGPGGKIVAGPDNLENKSIDSLGKEPAAHGKQQFDSMPEAVQRHVAFHAGKLEDANEAVQQGNAIGKRYGWEVAQKHIAQVDESRKKLAAWSDMAKAKGLDADAILSHLGAPDPQEFDAAKSWGDESTRGASQQPTGDKPAEPQGKEPGKEPAAASGPDVDAAKHAQVKGAVGAESLVAYYHNGDYHFLHDDKSKAAGVLGKDVVSHGDFRGALDKLVGAGHRVAVAEPEGKPALRQKPRKAENTQRPLLDQPAKTPPETPPAAVSEPPAAPPTSADPQATAEPTAEPEKPAKPTGKPKTKKQAEKPSEKPGEAGQGDFQLRGGRMGPDIPKGKQAALFDKLRDDPESPEAKATAREFPTAAAIATGQGPHRLGNQLGEAPPPGVQVTPEGLWTGTATLHAEDIKADPKRFQYKISGISDKGVTKELEDVKQYNPLYGGQLLVWRDPENGQTFVINGHHRHELASRSQSFTDPATGMSWKGEMQSYYIPAKNAAEARAMGALANMAEGRGTATDAAKFMRDSGKSIDDIQASGISLRGKVAADAAHLRDLSDSAFQRLGEGRLTEGRALAVARDLKDPELQDQLFARIDKREREGRAVPDSHVAEMAKEFELAGKDQGGHVDMFGEMMSDSLLDQRADLKASLRNSMASERNTFKAVSSSRRVGKIQSAGNNVLDVDANRDRAQHADEALYLFNRLANSKGPLSDAIQAAAQEFRNEPRKRKDILARLEKQAHEIIQAEWGGKPVDESERYSRFADNLARSLERIGAVRGTLAGSGGNRADDRLAGSQAFRDQLAGAIRPAVEQYSRGGLAFQGKRSATAANYRAGFSNANCASCAQFRSPGGCAIVAGQVSRQGVCDVFTPQRS